jgi:hypothetical protein
MIQTVEAIVDTTGKVNLLTEIRLKENRRAIVTILDEKPLTLEKKSNGGIREMFGTWKSGNPNSADNKQIDADLAKAYAEDHED